MAGLFNRVMSFARVVGSSLGPQRGAVLVDLGGQGFDDDPSDSRSEVQASQEVFSALGVVGRPPDPDPNEPDLLAEALAARVSDGLVPFAFRDQRILKWLNRGADPPTMPKKGQTIYAGYGGAFLSFETIGPPASPSNIVTLYCPFDRNGSGIPQKAHLITLDPTPGNESISVVHASGAALMMTEDEGVMIRADATTRIQVKPGEIYGCADKISWQGNVALGANTAAAVPLTPGPASPPCPSLFLSPV